MGFEGWRVSGWTGYSAAIVIPDIPSYDCDTDSYRTANGMKGSRLIAM